MIGHEHTALYGLDHGQTLAIALPPLLQIKREQKKAKLLQMVDRVFGIQGENDEETVTLCIEAIRAFFEKMGTKTHLSDYGLTQESIQPAVDLLSSNGRQSLGENGDITPAIAKEIYTFAL